MSAEILDYRNGKAEAGKPPKDNTLKFVPTERLRLDPAVRSASGISIASNKVFFPAVTPAFPEGPTLFVAESRAEYGVALEALMDPDFYDLEMQPLTVSWEDTAGNSRQHTWDQRWTFKDGSRRLVYVKSARALGKPETRELLNAIVAATPAHAANDYIVVNADQYHRTRVENLVRMFTALRDPDPVADEQVWATAKALPNLWRLRELCTAVSLPTSRAIRACFRLIAARKLAVDMNNVLCMTSYVRIGS